MARKTPLTPDQVREKLRSKGITLSAWAKAHGFDPRAVYRVMSGTDKAWYGRAHEIAVALGTKIPGEQSSGSIADRNTQTREAA